MSNLSTPWNAALVAALVPVALFLTGCPNECSNDSDCRDKNVGGKIFTCVKNKCVEQTAGFDAGTDAGADAGDGGNPIDSGTPDAGPFTKFVASLSPNQQVPPSGDTATGSGEVDLFGPFEDGGFFINFNVTHDVSGATSAHIHQGPGATNGLVVIPFPSVVSPITGSTAVTPGQAAALDRGLLYINVHSSAFPDGAIRGQLLKTGEVLYTARLEGVPGTSNTTDGGVQLVMQIDAGLKFDGVWDNVAGNEMCVETGTSPALFTAFCAPSADGYTVSGNLDTALPGFDGTVTGGLATVFIRDASDAGLLQGPVLKK